MITIEGHAKINWCLFVVGKREDGYHELSMLNQLVSLSDTLHFEPAETLELVIKGAAPIPHNQDNLILRAARLLQESAGVSRGARITLKKRIPVGAGLAGGSADAAATLKGLTQLWQLPHSLDDLATLGVRIGADIPYCIKGGVAQVTGIGDHIMPLPQLPRYWLVIVRPCRGLSTKQVFSSLTLPEKSDAPIAQVHRALLTKDFSLLQQSARNDLQQAAVQLRPDIALAIRTLKEHRARFVTMSGAGSAVFGVFTQLKQAEQVCHLLRQKYRLCFLAHTIG